jgi:hypothetical protein
MNGIDMVVDDDGNATFVESTSGPKSVSEWFNWGVVEETEVYCPQCCKLKCNCDCVVEHSDAWSSGCTTLNGAHGEATNSDDVETGADPFIAAMRDPFSEEAQGCRYPDRYAIPTTSTHVRCNSTITCTTAGTFDVVVVPSPVFSLFQAAGTMAWGGNVTYLGGAYGVIPRAELADVMSSFRVVAIGVRLKNMQAPGTAVGKLEIAQVPCGRYLPSAATLSAITPDVTDMLILLNGALSTGAVLPTLVNLPDSDEYVVQELMSNDILCQPKINAAVHEYYRSCNESMLYTSTYALAGEGTFYNASTGVVGTAGNGVDEATGGWGWNNILIRGRGFTGAIAAFDLELVYHLEGQPRTTSYNASGVGLSNAMKPSIVMNEQAAQSGIRILNNKPGSRLIDAAIIHKLSGGLIGGTAKSRSRARKDAGYHLLESVSNRLGLPSMAHGSMGRKSINAAGGKINKLIKKVTKKGKRKKK